MAVEGPTHQDEMRMIWFEKNNVFFFFLWNILWPIFTVVHLNGFLHQAAKARVVLVDN